MPKIDPITGCEVMTIGEFWNSEAEHEGKGRSGGDLMNDYFTEIEEDNRRCEDEIKNNKAETFQVLKRLYDEDPDSSDHIPVAIISIISVQVSQSMRCYKTGIIAEVMCKDGVKRFVSFGEASYSGSFYEPPDSETWLNWSNTNPKEVQI